MVWGEKITACTGIDMTHHHEETCLLEVHVGIDIHQWIIAHLNIGAAIVLNGKLTDGGTIVQGLVLGEIAHVATKVNTQHTGYLEPQVEVGIYIQVGHGDNLSIARLLPGDDIFPVQRPKGEVLRQLQREQTDVARRLLDLHQVSRACVFGIAAAACLRHRVLLGKIGVVLEVVYGHTQRCARAPQTKESLDVGAYLFVQAIIIPEEMLGVVMPVLAGGVNTVEPCPCRQGHRVAEESEIEVAFGINFQLCGILAT